VKLGKLLSDVEPMKGPRLDAAGARLPRRPQRARRRVRRQRAANHQDVQANGVTSMRNRPRRRGDRVKRREFIMLLGARLRGRPRRARSGRAICQLLGLWQRLARPVRRPVAAAITNPFADSYFLNANRHVRTCRRRTGASICHQGSRS